MPQIDLSILNQRQTPAFYADVLANRPAAGFIGRIFVSTNTFEFYRDNGTGWDLIGGPGAGTITGSGAAGQISYWNGASTITGSNDLFFDAVNGHLGIGTITPGTALDVHHDQSTILQLNQTAINDTRIAFQLSGSALWRLGNFYNGGANDFELFDVIGAQATLTVKKTTGQVLIGTSTVGSGKLVVASATGDNGIQVVGATAPSLRIDNAASGPTKRAGLGIATALNNFIQGAVDRDFCIFNGSTAAASPILFGIYDAGLTNVQEAARISAARNFLIGTTTDAGSKFQVNGNSNFSGTIQATNTISTSNGTITTVMSFGGSGGLIGTSSNSNLDIRTNNTQRATFFAGGNVGINTGGTDAGFRLDVNGTARVQGVLTTTADLSIQGFMTVGTGGGNVSSNIAMGFRAGVSNTSGTSNVFLGRIAGENNTTGTQNTNVGFGSGAKNTTTSFNTNIGFGAGSENTGSSNTNVGNNALFNQTTGSNNIAIGSNAAIKILGGVTNLTIANTSIFIGNNTQANANSETNQIVIGNSETGLGSNTTIIGNSSTILTALRGNLLIGTTSNGASKLRIVGLPTSAAGLSSGDVYSNLGVLTIVP